MLDKLEKGKLRKQLFYHLDGLAMCGVVPVLQEWGLVYYGLWVDCSDSVIEMQ